MSGLIISIGVLNYELLTNVLAEWNKPDSTVFCKSQVVIIFTVDALQWKSINGYIQLVIGTKDSFILKVFL